MIFIWKICIFLDLEANFKTSDILLLNICFTKQKTE